MDKIPILKKGDDVDMRAHINAIAMVCNMILGARAGKGIKIHFAENGLVIEATGQAPQGIGMALQELSICEKDEAGKLTEKKIKGWFIGPY